MSTAAVVCSQVSNVASIIRTWKGVTTEMPGKGEFTMIMNPEGGAQVPYFRFSLLNANGVDESSSFNGKASTTRMFVKDAKIPFRCRFMSGGLCDNGNNIYNPAHWAGSYPTTNDSTGSELQLKDTNITSYFDADKNYTISMEINGTPYPSTSTSTSTSAVVIPSSTSASKSTTWLIIGIIAAVLIVIIVGVVIFFVVRSGNKASASTKHKMLYN